MQSLWLYLSDPEVGEPRSDIAPGTSFDELENSWRCPQCGAGINRFIPRVNSSCIIIVKLIIQIHYQILDIKKDLR